MRGGRNKERRKNIEILPEEKTRKQDGQLNEMNKNTWKRKEGMMRESFLNARWNKVAQCSKMIFFI